MVKPKRYVLVIAEKPKAAFKIARALSRSKLIKQSLYGIPYWVFYNNGVTYVIASAAGHLFTLATGDYGFPVFNYHWVPSWVASKEAKYTKPYYLALKKLCKNAIAFINACDYDIEGSVIGYLIIRELGNLNKAYRMRFSTLTPQDLRKAFSSLSKGLDMPMIEAGLCRHELDWLWGINVSRALMYAVKRVTGKKVILSAGRVQSPTLMEVVSAEKQRNLFIPIPTFNINVQVLIGGKLYSLEYTGSPFTKKIDAEKALNRIKREKWGIIENIRYEVEKIKPPPPFNLGDLQAEAAKIHGFSPLKTQEVAEQLYLDALISYPRTNSQKLPPTIGYESIMGKLKEIPEYAELVKNLLLETSRLLKPHEGGKTDPAHPAIYPTGLKPKNMTIDKQKIYDLIVRRFLATFSGNIVLQSLTIYLKISNYRFRLKLRKIYAEGWLKYYPYLNIDYVENIPSIGKGQKIPIAKAKIIIGYSRYGRIYNKSSLLKWMESVNIGTESTRARIIESLFLRGYLKAIKGKIEVTPLGYAISEVLERYFKDLTSVELTRKFEKMLNDIRERRVRREDIVKESKNILSNILLEFKDKAAEKAGIELAKSLKYIPVENKCTICGNEVLKRSLCKNHSRALEVLTEKYKVWANALGTCSWKEYLEKISKLNISGKWVKEVAQAILKGYIEVNPQ